jgi:hypothetical protein
VNLTSSDEELLREAEFQVGRPTQNHVHAQLKKWLKYEINRRELDFDVNKIVI